MKSGRDRPLGDARTITSVGLLFACLVTAQGGSEAEAFRAECRLKAEAGEETTIRGRDGWLFLRNELRHVGAGRFWGADAQTASRASREDRRDPLPAILDFHQQLKKLGIELILVPVPPKVVVYPDMVSDALRTNSPAPPRLDAAHQEFYALLTDKGVQVMDLYPELASHRLSDEGAMYCKSDTHWSGLACVRVAQIIARDLRQRRWFRKVPKEKYEARTERLNLHGDLARALPPGDAAARETIEIRVVSGKDGEKLEPDPHSPILVLADSHGLVFHARDDMHAEGAGFWSQLTYELGFPSSLIAVRGSGATPARVTLYRKGKQDRRFLSSKKVVIWLFTAREFTETGGWAIVPVKK
ncbi:MAG: hypothetical protein HQ559_02760 [Lentisphaerae bacterium]|nr:hypothetical protein [Lentisphaerota bacterium]